MRSWSFLFWKVFKKLKRLPLESKLFDFVIVDGKKRVFKVVVMSFNGRQVSELRVGYAFYFEKKKRNICRNYLLDCNDSKPSSWSTFFLKVPPVDPVFAEAALYLIGSNLWWKELFNAWSNTIWPWSKRDLLKTLYLVIKDVLGNIC